MASFNPTNNGNPFWGLPLDPSDQEVFKEKPIAYEPISQALIKQESTADYEWQDAMEIIYGSACKKSETPLHLNEQPSVSNPISSSYDQGWKDCQELICCLPLLPEREKQDLIKKIIDIYQRANQKLTPPLQKTQAVQTDLGMAPPGEEKFLILWEKK